MRVDIPNISPNKSNEQNIQAIKAYLSEMADTVNYLLAKVENIEKTISEREG